VISKQVREALINRDEKFISELIKIQSNMDFIDLNIGPAKGDMEEILPWLASLVKKYSDLNISFDTTNSDEMRNGLENFDGKTFINSTSSDEPRLSRMTDMAAEFGSNLIALTLSKETGIPKTSDGRLEIAFNIYEKCLEKDIDSEKLFFDPLILPVNVEQSQGLEAINTIKMIKESFDPPVKTVVGLSNISNGCPKEIRPLINRVYACLAFGAGLDAAIIDAKDVELVRILKMLSENIPQSDIDNLYIKLAQMIREFGELDDVEFDKKCVEQLRIIKTAGVLLNREIYSHSFTQI
ncbi:MAG TPA: dihydropteroate synthase, partial [Candidatus Stercorousia faecigallinarum]|nr:dihydropteroate synthase [Candidatus Stercorousia faecigallinarum]